MADPKNTPSGPALAGDDRNIVAIGDETPGLSLEDHLFLFWNKYKVPVIAGSLALIAAVAGKTSYDAYVAAKERQVREEYAAVTGVEGLPAFIATHAGHPLVAVAQMRLADDHFSNKRYSEAVAAFDAAVAVLPAGDAVAARARLGAGVALLLASQPDAGRQRLAALADDATAPKSYRAQAAYQHAVSLGAAGDLAGLRTWADRVGELDPDGAWAQRATNLRRVAVAGTPAPAPAPVPPAAIAAPEAGAAPAPTPAPSIEFKPGP